MLLVHSNDDLRSYFVPSALVSTMDRGTDNKLSISNSLAVYEAWGGTVSSSVKMCYTVALKLTFMKNPPDMHKLVLHAWCNYYLEVRLVQAY